MTVSTARTSWPRCILWKIDAPVQCMDLALMIALCFILFSLSVPRFTACITIWVPTSTNYWWRLLKVTSSGPELCRYTWSMTVPSSPILQCSAGPHVLTSKCHFLTKQFSVQDLLAFASKYGKTFKRVPPDPLSVLYPVFYSVVPFQNEQHHSACTSRCKAATDTHILRRLKTDVEL